MWACQFADKSSTIRGIEDVSITCVKISTCRLCGSSDHPELRGCCNRDPKFAADSIRRCECFDQLSGCCFEYVSMSSKRHSVDALTKCPNDRHIVTRDRDRPSEEAATLRIWTTKCIHQVSRRCVKDISVSRSL